MKDKYPYPGEDISLGLNSKGEIEIRREGAKVIVTNPKCVLQDFTLANGVLPDLIRAARAASDKIVSLRALAKPEDMCLAEVGDCDEAFSELLEAVSRAEQAFLLRLFIINMNSNEPPKLSEFCCGAFHRLAQHFGWMRYLDCPDILSMPYIQDGDDKLRINFCPSCGKSIRDINIKRIDLEDK